MTCFARSAAVTTSSCIDQQKIDNSSQKANDMTFYVLQTFYSDGSDRGGEHLRLLLTKRDKELIECAFGLAQPTKDWKFVEVSESIQDGDQ
jgi:hypothetical protein